MTGLPRTTEQAIAWAKTGGGKTFPGLCDHYVGEAFGLSHSGYETALAHWQASSARHTDDHPDIGSLVFFETGKPAGHVAIVTGYDKNGEPLVTTTHTNGGKPTTMRLDQVGLSYLGWAAPDFQGRTAQTINPTDAPKDDDPAVAVQPGDVSGIDTRDDVTRSASLTQDTLTPKQAAEQAGFTWDFVKSHPEIHDVFDEAIKNDWFNKGQIGKDLFTNAVQDTTWAQNNSGFAQQYILDKERGGEAFAEQQRVAAELVRKTAVAIGANLTPDQISFFADQTLMNGWNQSGRETFLTQALTGNLTYQDAKGKTHAFTTDFLDYKSGAPSSITATLKNAAYKQGVTYSDDWYRFAVNAIQGGLGTVDTYLGQINQMAASAFPVFADKIAAGANAIDLASPYTTRMQQILELPENSVGLNDPMIKRAMGGVDDKGNPTAMSLWDFEKALKQDSRWQYTKQANDEVSSLTQKIVSMFGYGG